MRWNKLHRRQILEETLVLIESYENSLEDEIQRVRKAKKLIKKADKGQTHAVNALRAMLHNGMGSTQADFVLPKYDVELASLIRERAEDRGPYNAQLDYERINKIFARLAELGGHSLFWT